MIGTASVTLDKGTMQGAVLGANLDDDVFQLRSHDACRRQVTSRQTTRFILQTKMLCNGFIILQSIR